MVLNGFPYADIVFGTDGLPVDVAQRGVPPLLALDEKITDLLVISHGWLEDAAGARARYQQITASMAQVGGAPAGLGVVGVIWPSERFAETHAQAEEVSIGDVLNLATYYQMKARSGLVGQTGLLPILVATLARRPGLRIHLAGHSFGARLVTATVAADGAPTMASMVLLQGAFTHYGFAEQWDGKHDGVFRAVVRDRRVTGPLVVTFSSHDTVLGVAYPLASRLAEQDDLLPGIGGPHDRYGAIGFNGALATPEARRLRMPAVGEASPLVRGAVCNLDSSAFIPDHYSVSGPEVAQTIIAAMR